MIATDKIEELGIKADNSKHSYDELKNKYETMQKNFLYDKDYFETKSREFSEKQAEYMKKVEEWNKVGGAPENVYNELNIEMEFLKNEFEKLKILENKLNKQIENINVLVGVINKTAGNLNLSTTTLNNINKERGVYKTMDGGKTWKQTLFIDDNTGCVDLDINPSNPNEVYAGMWFRVRRAWKFEESGKTSGIYKSNDGNN